VAKYKKKRARELKQDKFRDWTLKFFDQVGDRLEGKGTAILYGLGGIIVVAVLVAFFLKWSHRRSDEARLAMGRAITIASAPVSATGPVTPTSGPSFSNPQERAQRAIDIFQQVADKYGDPYRTEARYFVATNLLLVDRNKALAELTALTKSSDGNVAALSKFALAQALETDAKYDDAATLYRELAAQSGGVVTPETANLRLAIVYKMQGKKKEASDILFNIVDAARKAKDSEGNAQQQSQAARDAAQELQKVDPERYAQLPPEAPPNLPF